jgi:hypothetical protein
LFAALALASSMLFAGCWGSSKSASLQLTGGSSVADTATAVGIQKCFTCHQNRLDVSNPADNATTIFNDWQGSIHALGSSSHVDYATMAASGCSLKCHDPNGDGKNLLALGIASEKPVVGCEGCHGGGSEHFGVGPMAYPKPDATVCGQCHDANMPHLAYHPNGLGGKDNPGIYAAYAASAHSRSAADGSHGSPTIAARCSRCHTDEGARKYSLNDNVSSGSPIDCSVLNPALTEFGAVQCRTCHKAHKSPELLASASIDNTKSAQYNTCTRCHQETPQIHTGHSAQIAKTHYDNGARAVGSKLTGFVVRKAAGSACTDCHNPHSADLTENKQWHASAHGDFNGEAWKHYDFKGASRQSCQRCHTTTGFSNYIANQAGYNPANNVFVAKDNQAEMLYCYGCHKMNATGFTVARVAVENAYLPAGPDNTSTITISGKGNSELCLNCHSGQIAGSQLAAKSVGLDLNNTTFGSFNSHYLSAGMTIFQDNTGNGTAGYQFAGKNYAKPVYYAHDKIGTTAATHGTTQLWADNTSGPCVGCHMTTPNSATDPTVGKHRFRVFSYDNADAITGITSATCVKCHEGNYALTVAGVTEAREAFETRIALLKGALDNAGIYYAPASYPYFFNDSTLRASANQYKTWTTAAATISAATGNTISAAELIGVAFNLNYLNREPGAWAHNNIYSNRLLFDSLEKLGIAPGFTRP